MNIKRKESYCFNCNTSLGKEDNFCRRCGQENHDKKVSLKMLLKDFLGDYLTFDSKIWKSLKLLLFSPGQLTLLYSEGKITAYIRPIRLMLFLSLIYVVCFSIYLDKSEPSVPNNSLVLGDERTVDADYLYVVKNYESVDEYIEKERKNEDYLLKILIAGSHNLVGGNKNVMNEVFKKTSNLLFFLLPLVSLVFKVSFWRNKLFYVEHFIHVLHLYSFFFVLTVLMMLISWLFSIMFFYTILIVLFFFFVYLFLSFRKVYKRSRFITLLKVISTSFSFILMLMLGFVASLIITISFS